MIYLNMFSSKHFLTIFVRYTFPIQTNENPIDVLTAGKRTLALNLKHKSAQSVLRRLCRASDILIDPYRPGILEKLGLGPTVLMADNPRLIYARLTGFGQTGPLRNRVGHDINYVAVSGVLSMLGRKGAPPTAPVNILADMAGGGLMCAFGILVALLERESSGLGQVIDASMTEGSAYVASWLMRSQKLPIWGALRGDNMLDSGRFFYDAYETSDGKYMSVGTVEAEFFKTFIETLGLPDLVQYVDIEQNEQSRKRVAEVFRQKSQAEWSEIFNELDACVFPVLDWDKAPQNAHNLQRRSFVVGAEDVVPTPAPRLSRTPGVSSVERKDLAPGGALEVLREIGIEGDEVITLKEEGALILPMDAKL